MKNFDSLRNIFGGYYLERRNGTGLLVPPRSPEGGLRWFEEVTPRG